jgi:Tfp pilus assembly protein PilN
MGIKTLITDPMRDFVFDSDVIVERMRPIIAALVGSSIEPGWNPSFTVDLDLNKDGRVPLLYDERQTQMIAPDERPTPWFKPLMAASIVALALVTGAWFYLTQVDLPNQLKSIEKLQEEAKANKKRLADLNRLRQDNDMLTGKKRVLDNIVKKSQRWSDYLETIRRDTPAGVHIDAIRFKDDGAHIEGTARDFTNVSHLAINLGNEQMVKHSTIESASRGDKRPDVIVFSVLATLAGQGSENAVTSQIEPAPPLATNSGRSMESKAQAMPLRIKDAYNHFGAIGSNR